MTHKILIVDDSKLARMSVGRTLRQLRPDWTQIEAANADDAIVMVRQARPDIVLIDFNMPGRDGLELAAELKAIDANMPVAVVSANIQDEIVARSHGAGAAFLAKPLSEHDLAEFLTGAQARLRTAPS